MTRVEAVVFDLDGVLVDSEHLWSEVREQLAQERGGRWHDRAEADMMGMSSTEWSRYMHDVIGLEDPPAQINDEVVQRMLGRYERHLPVIEGAAEAVRRLAGAYRLGLASSANRPLIDAVLRETGLAEVFEATVSSEEVERGKPAPDVYLEAARRLGVRPGTVRGRRGLGERDPCGARRRHAGRRDPECALPTAPGRARAGGHGARLDRGAHPGGRRRSCVSRCVSSAREPRSTHALWPPRPIAFDSATSTCVRRASFGT